MKATTFAGPVKATAFAGPVKATAFGGPVKATAVTDPARLPPPVNPTRPGLLFYPIFLCIYPLRILRIYSKRFLIFAV